jgi:adenosine deaminase
LTSPTSAFEIQQALADLPKVDLHRHLEGSLRLTTLMDVAREEDLDLPHEEEQLREQVQIDGEQPKTLPNFLSKFRTLRKIYRSSEIIQRVTREAIEDAAADQIRYLELRFTPVALAQAKDFPLGEVMDWVVEYSTKAAAEFGLELGLIASVNRHESVEKAEQVAALAAEKEIVGLDLAGNEVEFPADPFHAIFRAARQAGLGTTVHAGEWSGADSVQHALNDMSAVRIGHGVRIMESPEAVRLAREQRAVFEVCLTSNLHSGVVGDMGDHPLPAMIDAGLQVTINTDDPGISNIRLSDEYFTAVSELGLSSETLKGMILVAAQASFLSKESIRKLEASLQDQLGLGGDVDADR